MEPAHDAALDWQASPWVGPSVGPGPTHVRAEEADGTGGPRGARAAGSPRGAGGSRAALDARGERRGRRSRLASDVEDLFGPVPGSRTVPGAPGAGGDAGPHAVELPAAPPAAAPARRRSPGGVGRRTVSQRAPRDLLPHDDAAEVARQVCLDQLSYTARTRAELATALDHRGVPDDVAAQVLDRFTEVGLIDDAAFAQAWVTRRSAAKALSGRALAQELRRRGVSDDVAGQALSSLDPDDEVQAARDLVDRKLRSTTSLAPDARLRRLVAMLGRKGHGPGVAYRVVREALAEEGLLQADDDGLEPDLD